MKHINTYFIYDSENTIFSSLPLLCRYGMKVRNYRQKDLFVCPEDFTQATSLVRQLHSNFRTVAVSPLVQFIHRLHRGLQSLVIRVSTEQNILYLVNQVPIYNSKYIHTYIFYRHVCIVDKENKMLIQNSSQNV